jgi:Site-specific recombinase XerD
MDSRRRPRRRQAAPSARIEAFLEMMAAERGASPHTLAAYAKDLADLAAFLASEDVAVESAIPAQLGDYFAALARTGMTPATTARRLSSLRQFYRYLCGEGWRADDPTTVLAAPRRARRLPHVLAVAEVERLIAAAGEIKGPEGARLVCLLELLYAAGLRVSELVSLPLAAFSRTRKLVLVRGKGAKERLVPLGGPARAALARYLRVRERFVPKAAGGAARFLSRRGDETGI